MAGMATPPRLPHAGRDYLAAMLITVLVGPLVMAPTVVLFYAWLTDLRTFHEVRGFWGILFFWCYVVGFPVGVLLGAVCAALQRWRLRRSRCLSFGFAALVGFALGVLPQLVQLLIGLAFSVGEHTLSLPKASEWQEIAAILFVGVLPGVACALLIALVVRRTAVASRTAVTGSPESPPAGPASSPEP